MLPDSEKIQRILTHLITIDNKLNTVEILLQDINLDADASDIKEYAKQIRTMIKALENVEEYFQRQEKNERSSRNL